MTVVIILEFHFFFKYIFIFMKTWLLENERYITRRADRPHRLLLWSRANSVASFRKLVAVLISYHYAAKDGPISFKSS